MRNKWCDIAVSWLRGLYVRFGAAGYLPSGAGSYCSSRRYVVVSAVYQVQDYLDDFFRSMERQTLDFKRHVQLVMVVDGATDLSADICLKWQRSYPHNIRVVQKANGGVSSARNLGIENAGADWITFIDPDDFVDRLYFESVDRFLDSPDAARLCMVSCRLMRFYERAGLLRDNHPLRFRFSSPDTAYRVADIGARIQMSAASAFFRYDLLRDKNILFDEKVFPVFEDAHFIARYLQSCRDSYCGHVRQAIYFYRKRKKRDSASDGRITHPARYEDCIRYGCLALLQDAAAEGEVPVWLQNMVLYHILSEVQRVEEGEKISPSQKETFYKLCHACLVYMRKEVLDKFSLYPLSPSVAAWLQENVRPDQDYVFEN